MPFFTKKKSKENLTETAVKNEDDPPHPVSNDTKQPDSKDSTLPPTSKPNGTPSMPRPALQFFCQLAQGSPTGIISGFTNVKELYKKIAECYEMKASDILFCTLNSHKIDMGKLLGGQIGLDDFIFVHVKGQPKEVEVTKSEDALGLTITDNGAGYAFIKRIKENSIMDKTPLVSVGDHIEKIDGKSLIGCRHFEVAKMLKEIPKGTTFLFRTVEPLQSGFSAIGPPSGKKGSSNLGTGKQTLRLSSKGPAKVEVADDVVNYATDKINNLLESFMGINDTDLAQSIWDVGCKLDNPHDFAVAMEDSDLKDFGFDEDIIFDFWGAISDAKSGRIKKVAEFSEQF